MPGSAPCPANCGCWKHSKPRVSREEDLRKRREDAKRRYWSNPARARSMDRVYREKSDHGMLPGQFEQTWEAQQGKCYLCGDDLSRERREVAIDHDHSCCPPNTSCSRCRRGLACQPCNRGIGFFRDSPERLERVAVNLRIAAATARARITAKPQQEALPIDIKRAARQQAG